MSNPRLPQIDADMFAAFLDNGMGDSATYTPPGGSAVPCTVLVDKGVQMIGAQSQMVSRAVTITALCAEVGTPVREGLWTVGAETWRHDEVIDADDGVVICTVTREVAP